MKTGNTGTTLAKNKQPSNSSLLGCTFTPELPAEQMKRNKGKGGRREDERKER